MASISSFAFLLLAFLLFVNLNSSYAEEVKPMFKDVCKPVDEEVKEFCNLYLRSITLVNECSDKACLVNGTVSDAYSSAQVCVKLGEMALKSDRLRSRDIKPTEVCLENFKSVEEILHDAFPLVVSGKYELIEENFKKIYQKIDICVAAYKTGANPYDLGIRSLIEALNMGSIVIAFQPPK